MTQTVFQLLGILRCAVAGLLALTLASAAPDLAFAQEMGLEVDVNQGVLKPMPIAVPVFGGAARSGEIASVIAANLERSGLFAPLATPSSVDPELSVLVMPRFASWRDTGIQALIHGDASVDGAGRLVVDFRLWDVGTERQLLGLQLTATPENWRRVAHKISDVVYERLTGEKGYFDTRIVFVSETGPRSQRSKRLEIMDQDGANPTHLTDGSSLVMTPRFSASSQELTYMALRPTGASLHLLNIETGREEKLGDFKGMVFAPRFSPDGGRVAFSLERNGNSDVVVMDLLSRQVRRLTSDPAIDTSPSFSPDGGQMVFNSDRGGSPQLYVMSASGEGTRRISQGNGRYMTPVWSPTGEHIAFTKQVGGQFHIGIMSPDGSGERLLTTSYLDEGPTWAPNGRVLMFFREAAGGDPALWTVDITGRILRPVPHVGAASDPAWSPLLP